jgi:hypothetical protein
VTSVLAGDVLRDDNPFADMLLRSRIAQQTRAPLAGEAGDETFLAC